jgi:hypothetical protein
MQLVKHARYPRGVGIFACRAVWTVGASLWRDMPARLYKTMTPTSRWGRGAPPTVRANLLNFPKAAKSPALIPFEPNPHGHGVLLPDPGWPHERMVSGGDIVLLQGHCELQACSVLRWLHARPMHQHHEKPQHSPLANPFELTCEPMHQLGSTQRRHSE